MGDSSLDSYTKIASKPVATAEQMIAYIKSKKQNVAQSVIDMIPLYLSEGEIEGIAGDIAFAQSCLETGNFWFAGSNVTLDQNNFCGMGVTSGNKKGNSFETPQIGIRAQIQHLKAYANTEPLVNECVDPRFRYVKRGCAEYVEWLGMQENPSGKGWASGAGYGSKILRILKNIRETEIAQPEITKPEIISAEPKKEEIVLQAGDLVSLTNDAKYYDGSDIPAWVKKQNWYIESITEDRVVIGENESGTHNIKSPVNSEYLVLVKAKPMGSFFVRVDIARLNIRTGPGTDYSLTGKYTGKGVFTIVEVSNGTGSNSGWGKLKSGAGWISLDYATKL